MVGPEQESALEGRHAVVERRVEDIVGAEIAGALEAVAAVGPARAIGVALHELIFGRFGRRIGVSVAGLRATAVPVRSATTQVDVDSTVSVRLDAVPWFEEPNQEASEREQQHEGKDPGPRTARFLFFSAASASFTVAASSHCCLLLSGSKVDSASVDRLFMS